VLVKLSMIDDLASNGPGKMLLATSRMPFELNNRRFKCVPMTWRVMGLADTARHNTRCHLTQETRVLNCVSLTWQAQAAGVASRTCRRRGRHCVAGPALGGRPRFLGVPSEAVAGAFALFVSCFLPEPAVDSGANERQEKFQSPAQGG